MKITDIMVMVAPGCWRTKDKRWTVRRRGAHWRVYIKGECVNQYPSLREAAMAIFRRDKG